MVIGFEYNPETGVITRLSDGRCEWTKDSRKYLQVVIDGKKWQAHRLAWILHYGKLPKGVIDHINGDKKDNRIVNLRDVTTRENSSNMKRHRNGRLVGATWHKATKKYESRIRVRGRLIHLGLFDTEIEAHGAYIKHREELK